MGCAVLILLLLVTSFVRLFLYIKSKSFANPLPTVEPCHPVIGNAMLVIGKSSSEQLFAGISRALANPTRLFRVMATVMPVVATNCPEMTQKILTSPICLEKAFLYKFFRLDSGLFAGNYDLWKSQRKAFNPSFNQKILHGFIPVFDKYAQELVESLGAFADGRKVANISSLMHRCSMKTVCATTIGVTIEKDSDADRLVELLIKVFHLAFKRLLRILWHVEWIYRWTKDFKKDQELRKEIYIYGDEIMRKAAERHSKGKSGFEQEATDINGNCVKLRIFMDQMLDANSGRKFTNIEIVDNFYTMIVGGSDTTGTQLNYIALALATHQEIQERVYQEICSVYPPDQEAIFSPESLKQLSYTDMFLKECLRLFPVVPMVVRKTLQDVDLDGFRVPKGNLLMVSIYNLHRRKDIWGPNADRFDPENFSPERSAGRHPYAFVPFSGGNRNCLGYRYAMINMKIIIVHLLRSFKLTSHSRLEDLRFRFEALLKTSNDPEIQLKRR